MTPAQLREAIRNLPTRQPIADALFKAHWPERRQRWFRHQQEHWIGWLTEHDRRGTMTAERVYDFIQSPPMLLWLAQASGCPETLVSEAAHAALRYHRSRKRECNAIRELIPWAMIARNLKEPS